MSTPTPESHPPKAKSADDQPKAEIPQYARVVGLTHLGVQPEWEYQGKTQEACDKFEITYELPKSRREDGKPHWISEDVEINYNDGDGNPQFRSRLMKRLLALCPDGEGDGGFNMPAIINKVCMVTPHHNKKGYANIAANAVVGVPMGTVVAELEHDIFDLSDWDKITKEMWEALRSPLTKKKIQQSLNYPGSALEAVVEGKAPPVDFNEDIPF